MAWLRQLTNFAIMNERCRHTGFMEQYPERCRFTFVSCVRTESFLADGRYVPYLRCRACLLVTVLR